MNQKGQVLALVGVAAGLLIAVAEGASTLGCARLVSIITVVAAAFGAGASFTAALVRYRAATPPALSGPAASEARQ